MTLSLSLCGCECLPTWQRFSLPDLFPYAVALLLVLLLCFLLLLLLLMLLTETTKRAVAAIIRIDQAMTEHVRGPAASFF